MADKTIGSMAAVLRATSGQFEADMRIAGDAVDTFKRRAEGAVPKIPVIDQFKLGAGIAAGIAAAAAAARTVTASLGKFFDQIRKGEEVSDFAAQIGSTTEELTSLRYAADISGSSAEVLDASLQKVTTRLGEARQGSKEAADTFKALGLNVEALVGMTAGQRFIEIAEQFRKIKNPADQAAVAIDLFGKQGVRLVNILKQGRAGIAELQAESTALGNTLSGRNAAMMSAAADSIDKVKAAWNGLWNELVVNVLPIVKAVSDAIVTTVRVVTNLIASIDKTVFSAIAISVTFAATVVAVGKVIDICFKLVKALRLVQKALIVTQALSGPKGWVQLGVGLAVAAGAIAMVNAAFDDMEESANAATTAAMATGDAAIDAQKKMSQTALPGVESALRGSAAAASAAFTSARLQSGINALDISKRQLVESQKHTQYLKKIADASAPGSGATRPVDI